MPVLYPCSVCGKPFKRQGKGTRCSTCAPYGWPADRPKMSSTWDTTRKQKLQANPWCENPYRIHEVPRVRAVTVDHILARRFGGTDKWDNLMSLCDRCRGMKDHEDRERGKRHRSSGA